MLFIGLLANNPYFFFLLIFSYFLFYFLSSFTRAFSLLSLLAHDAGTRVILQSEFTCLDAMAMDAETREGCNSDHDNVRVALKLVSNVEIAALALFFYTIAAAHSKAHRQHTRLTCDKSRTRGGITLMQVHSKGGAKQMRIAQNGSLRRIFVCAQPPTERLFRARVPSNTFGHTCLRISSTLPNIDAIKERLCC